MIRLSAKEMHIYVTQGLQRRGSQRKDKQLPQAIDVGLNLAQSRIIKSRLIEDINNPLKFEVNQKYVTDIQSIINLDVELPVYKIGTKSYAPLPTDFAYLLSDKSQWIEDCQTGFATAFTDITEYITVVPFKSTKSSPPYFVNLVVSYKTNTKTLTTPGVVTSFENTYLVDIVLSAFRELGAEVYWEQYKDIIRPDSFILVSRTQGDTGNITIDTATAEVESLTKTINAYTANNLEVQESVNRDTKADFLDMANLGSNFHKTVPESPLACIASNQLIVLGDKRFLVNKIILSYIRIPKRINLSLGQGSELNGTVHQEICDVAIQILKKQEEDPSYQVEVQDNKGRVV